MVHNLCRLTIRVRFPFVPLSSTKTRLNFRKKQNIDFNARRIRTEQIIRNQLTRRINEFRILRRHSRTYIIIFFVEECVDNRSRYDLKRRIHKR